MEGLLSTGLSVRLGKNHFFVNSEIFRILIWRKKRINYAILRQESVNQLFNPNAFFLFILTGAIWYYHAIHIVFTYFASFTGYEDDILEVSSNLHVQESKFGVKIYKFGGTSKKKLNSAEFMEFVFSRSVAELGSWNFERRFTFPNLSCVTCHMSSVKCHMSHVICIFFKWLN